LDGIPLAIELAAARVRVLSPEQIADRLDDRFRLLTGGSRTALPRQRTLQALIDWSYDLLPEAECTLLCRLSAFTGGWTLEAAEIVTGFEPLDSYEVLDLLEQLVKKSLVVAESTELGMRYHMLESIRQYAQEKLADSGEGELLRERHLSYYLAQSRDAFKAFMDLEPPGDWGVRFKPEADNFRAAWARALEVGVEPALGFASSFSTAWSQVMPLVEVHRFQQTALALADVSPVYATSNVPEENRLLLGRALISAASVALGARQFPQAIEYASHSAAIAEEIGDQATWVFARTIRNIGSGFTGGKEFIQNWLDEDYDLAMRYGSNYLKAICLIWWGSVHLFATGQYSQESQKRWDKGMTMLLRSGDLWTQGSALRVAADLSHFRGEDERAKQLAEQVLEIYTELGDKYAANPARTLLADLTRQQGDLELAARLYRETILIWHDTGNADAGVRTVETLAYITRAQAKDFAGSSRQARLENAVTLIGAADALRQNIGRPVNFLDKPEYERELAALREEAGEEAFQSAWRKGQAMDLDQVVLLATEEITLPSAS
jgi:predicted ATPase